MNTQNQMAMAQIIVEDFDVARNIPSLMRQGAAFYLDVERSLDVTVNVPSEELGTRWTSESRETLEEWRSRIEEHFLRVLDASGLELQAGRKYKYPYVPDPSAA